MMISTQRIVYLLALFLLFSSIGHSLYTSSMSKKKFHKATQQSGFKSSAPMV